MGTSSEATSDQDEVTSFEGMPHQFVGSGVVAKVTALFVKFDVWLRNVVLQQYVEPRVPENVTANMISTSNSLVAVAGVVLALYIQAVDVGFWWKAAGQMFTIVLIFAYSFFDDLDGVVARARGLACNYGGTLDHWVDSMCNPLTAAAGAAAAGVPPAMVAFTTVMIASIFVMEAIIENDTDVWYEPPPGGVGASISSMVFVLINVIFNALAHLDVIESQTARTAFMCIACPIIATPIVVVLQMWGKAGVVRGFTGAALYWTSFIVFALLLKDVWGGWDTVWDESKVMRISGDFVPEVPDGITLIQFLVLASAISNRVCGGMIIHTCDGKRHTGFDWRLMAWTVILAFVFYCRRAGMAVAEPELQQHLETALRVLPYVAAGDLLLRSLVDIRSLHVRVYDGRGHRAAPKVKDS